MLTINSVYSMLFQVFAWGICGYIMLLHSRHCGKCPIDILTVSKGKGRRSVHFNHGNESLICIS